MNYKNETLNTDTLLSGELLSTISNERKEQELIANIYLLEDPEVIDRLLEIQLEPSHFNNLKLGRLYQKAVDKTLEGNTAKLSDIPDEVIEMYHLQDLSPSLPLENAKEIIRIAKNRKAMAKLSQSVQILTDPDKNFTDILPNLESILEQDTSKETSAEDDSLQGLLQSMWDIKGIPTGIDKLDRAGVKFNNGQITAIGADTGAGKTTFLLNVIAEQLKLENKILFFSLEETKRDIENKMLSLLSGFSADEIKDTWDNKTKGYRDPIKAEVLEVEYSRIKRNLFIEGKEGMTISQLKTRAKNLHRRYNFTLIAVDYWQLLEGNTDTSLEKYISTANGLLSLALSINLPIIVLGQVDKNSSRMTDLDRNAFSGSKQLSNNAYYVMMLQLEKDTNETILKVVKSRHPNHMGLTAPLKLVQGTQKIIKITR